MLLIEHLIYSTAIAIIFGMIHYRLFGRDYSWIIIASAVIPDIDIIPKTMGIIVLIFGKPIVHGSLHNIAVMILYATSVAILLHKIDFKFIDSFLFACIGFVAHLFEDALVFNPAYPFFWPIDSRAFGIGMLNYTYDFYGIADRAVLFVGLILLASSAILRTALEGTNWISRLLSIKRNKYFVRH